jgi:DNA-binding NtrC family response regulator
MAVDVNILVVDDDRDICEYMKTLLEASGYNVATLSDPTLATDLVKKSEFHVLIVDLMMPRMDGIQLIQSIRKVDNDVAIIVFTGYPSLDTAVEALKLNVSDYIKKPFEPDELRQKISDILRKKGVKLNPEEELHRTIGVQIRQFRKDRDLTLKQLSRKTGLSVSLLSQIERAESSASVGSLYKISAALGVKLTQLFGEF